MDMMKLKMKQQMILKKLISFFLLLTLVAACGEKKQAAEVPECVRLYKCQDEYVSDRPSTGFNHGHKKHTYTQEYDPPRPSFGMSYGSGKVGPMVGPFVLTDKGLELGFGF